MQLNLYVPKEREAVLRALDEMARTSGRSKNALVLDAIERYLGELAAKASSHPKLRTYRLGIKPWTREDLYEERMDHIMGVDELRVAESTPEYQTNS